MNLAQQMLVAMGVDPIIVMIGSSAEKSRSYTKRGPGRIHQQGKPGAAHV